MTSLWHLDVGIFIWKYYFPIYFFICDILKETACKYLTFNLFLYIKGFWRIFWRHWRNWQNHLWMPKSKSIDYPYTWELSLGYLLSPKNRYNERWRCIKFIYFHDQKIRTDLKRGTSVIKDLIKSMNHFCSKL